MTFLICRDLNHQPTEWLSTGYSLPVSQTHTNAENRIDYIIIWTRLNDLMFIARPQVENPLRRLKDSNSDSVFRSVSSSDWGLFVLSAEIQGSGGGADPGGMTARWLVK